MASPNIWPSGLNLAGTVFENGPATLQLDGATYLSGAVQWVDTIGGNDSNAGSLPNLPVRTLSQAITNSAANGVIVIGEGSSENVASALSASLAGLMIFGCGSGSSRPRYRWTGSEEFIGGFNFTGAHQWVENIYFPASTGTAALGRVYSNSDGFTVLDCYFECGATDTVQTLSVGGDCARVSGTSFVVTASRPSIGLYINGTSANTLVEGCTFDGGSYGWSDYAFKVPVAATVVRQRGNTFINQSNVGHTVTATSYQLFGVNADGTSNVLLTA